ncbi:MAG: putative metal-binding motif-containing protein, partial [Armatimonadetes bacterium]|nr:putative metal-binding motif-containing protein [Armatimonadota bacterium]
MSRLLVLSIGATLLLATGCPGKPEETGSDPSFLDADGDGYDSDVDCDDGDATVYPDAPELCNGVDDDCDGEVDEDAASASTWYADLDGDGFGDPASTALACAVPEGFVADGTDCDDGDAAVNPAA